MASDPDIGLPACNNAALVPPPPRTPTGLQDPSRTDRGLRVSVARSIEEVERLRPVWEPLQGWNLPADLDYFLAIAAFNPQVVRPHVVLVEQPDAQPCILAAHLYDLRLDHPLGAWTPFRPAVRAINLFRGHLGSAAPDALACGLRTLLGELGGDADAILLRYLQDGSPLYRAAMRTFPARFRQRCAPTTARWACDVGSTFAETLSMRSRTTRENVRRIQRRLNRDFGGRISVRVFREPDDAQTLFDDIDEVAVKTYQTPMRSIFRGNEFERQLTEVALRKGWYRGFVLYLDASPIAFWTGYSYGGVFGWRGVTGYDPHYRSYSVGTYLLTAVLDELSRDPDVNVFSLGSGDFPYKRFFGDRRNEEVDVRVFAPSLRGIWINAVGSGVQGVGLALDRVAGIPAVESRMRALRRRHKQRATA